MRASELVWLGGLLARQYGGSEADALFETWLWLLMPLLVDRDYSPPNSSPSSPNPSSPVGLRRNPSFMVLD